MGKEGTREVVSDSSSAEMCTIEGTRTGRIYVSFSPVPCVVSLLDRDMTADGRLLMK